MLGLPTLDPEGPKIIDQWSQDGRRKIPGTAKERRDAIHELVEEKVLTRQEREDPKRGKVKEVILNGERARELKYLA
jgi:hypothetical protein